MTDQVKHKSKLQAAVVRLLKPLVRILLRYGIPYGVFAEIARWTYVEVAFKESSLPGRKLSDSRVSILTGLSRKEVSRLKGIDFPVDEEAVSRFNRAARVVGGWVRDDRFTGFDGEPAALTYDDGECSFSALVKTYGGDVPARAILDELVRVGTVRIDADTVVSLSQRAYVPNEGLSENIEILGTDVSDLLETIGHNLDPDTVHKHFQRKVCYDNVPHESVARFRELSRERGQAVLEELDRFLVAQDRDLNPQRGGTGRKRVGLGIYYIEEDLEDASPSKAEGSDR